MDQIYFVSRPAGRLDSPICLYRYGNFCYAGPVELANGTQNLEQLPGAMRYLQSIQGTIPFYAETDNIPDNSPHRLALDELNKSMDFIYDELSTADEALAEFIEQEPWLDSDGAALYFEFETKSSFHFENAQVVFAKTFRGDVMLTLIFHAGTFYVTLTSASDEQGLVDTLFPQIYGKQRGLQLRAYDHPVFTKMTVWESSGEVPDPTTVALGGRQEPTEPIDTDLSGAEGAYTQIYALLRPENLFQGSTHREALFRFGNWCYAGSVDFGVDSLHLGDVPEVLPALQRQQGNLAYLCEANLFPTSSRFAPVLRKFTASINFLTAEMLSVESDLERLSSMGLTSWIDEDWAASFFEMQFGHVPELDNVDLIASKIYTGQGVILHCLWFGGSLYCVLADATEDQPLLDVAFPDVTARCRGVQVKAYSSNAAENFPDCPIPRKLSVWEGRRKGVPGVGHGNVSAIKDDQFAALISGSQSKSMAEQIRAKARARAELENTKRASSAVQSKPQSTAAASETKIEENADEEQCEGKSEDVAPRTSEASSNAAQPAPATQEKELRSSKGDDTMFKVKAPHHLPPMGGASRLKGLAKLGHVDSAPWDDSGRPIGASPNKMNKK